MRVTHPNGCPHGSAQNGGPAIDRELCLTVKDDEHLFGGVMKMMSHASTWHDLTTMHEVKIDIHRCRGNQQHASHIAGTLMGSASLVLAGIRMTDAGFKLRLGVRGTCQESGNKEQSQRLAVALHYFALLFW
jgi:hypothetical protein